MTAFTPDDKYAFTVPLDGGGTATHDVYVIGTGQPVLLLQKLPGIGPATFRLIEKLNGSGFKVSLPHMLGKLGKETTVNGLRLFCVRREFNMFLKGRQSPIAGWMRALCADIATRENGQKLGVIGMCLTGSFALVLMAEDAVNAAVASQPALPAFGGDSLHMSDKDIETARAAMTAKGNGLAMRFEGDKLVPDRLKSAFLKAFDGVLDWEHYVGKDHSLLTLDFHDPAYNRVDQYLHARLDQ